MPATYDDASLVLQIVRWSTEFGLDQAGQAVFSDDFDPADASLGDPSVQKVLQFGEVVGTLVKHGVLDRDLTLDLWWVEGLWARVASAVRRERDRLGESRLYENMEALATGGPKPPQPLPLGSGPRASRPRTP